MRDPTAHAEIDRLRAAATFLDTYRLSGASLYVTLEPCVMCVGAIINARIARVIYGAHDPRPARSARSYDIGRDGRLNHRSKSTAGISAANAPPAARILCARRSVDLIRAFGLSKPQHVCRDQIFRKISREPSTVTA